MAQTVRNVCDSVEVLQRNTFRALEVRGTASTFNIFLFDTALNARHRKVLLVMNLAKTRESFWR